MSASLSAQSKAQSLRYFDTSYYLNSNPDVLAAVAAGRTTAFDHFVNFGAKEGRSPTSLFDSSSYLANNTDIAFAVGAGRIHSAWDHFVNMGIVEGRSNGAFVGVFDSAAYLAANNDVAAAISPSGFRSAYEHFLLFGDREGRAAFNKAGDAISTQLVLTADAPSVTEGNAGTKALTFTLTLSSVPTEAVTVNYKTLNSGTATANDDYQVVAGTLTFAAGQRTTTLTVNVLGDTEVEQNETVQVQFSGARLKSSVTATGTITNDDTANAPVGAVSDSNAAANSVAENSAAGTVVGITAAATDPQAGDTVSYALTSNPGNLFAIDAATGVVTVAGALDFETAASHSITVRATSSDGTTSNADFAITVTDVAEPQTFTLTTGVDSLTGTANNDTFVGSETTLTSLDSIDGGAGSDTLLLSFVPAFDFDIDAFGSSVAGVEIVSINAADNVFGNFSGWTGVETVTVNALGGDVSLVTSASSSVTVSGVQDILIEDAAATTISITANDGNDSEDDLVTVTASSLTTLNLDVAEGTKVTVDTGATLTINATTSDTDGTVGDHALIEDAGAGAVKSLTVNITGDAYLDLDFAVATSLAITGSGDLSLLVTDLPEATSLTVAGSVSLDANVSGMGALKSIVSTSTGDIELIVAATALAVTTGSGDDFISQTAALVAQQVISTGAGDDVVELGNIPNGAARVDGGVGEDTIEVVSASVGTNHSAMISNFEVLAVSDALAANLNVANFDSIQTVFLAGGMSGGFTISGIKTGATVGFGAGSTGQATLTVTGALAGTADVVNVTLDAAVTDDFFEIEVNDVETVNVTSTTSDVDPSSVVNTVGLIIDEADTLNVTGDSELVLDLAMTSLETVAAADFDAGLTVDLTLNANDVTITVGDGDNTITGGDGDDVITTGAGDDIIDGGVGDDTIFAGNGDNTITGGDGDDVITTGAGDDIIDGGDGDDTIFAGNGTNSITGGLGADTMTGGTGVDTYIFGGVGDSQGVTIDTITNFDAGNDRLDLSGVTLVVGAYLGEANGYGAVLTAFSGSGPASLEAVLDTSTNTLYVDVNGDGALTSADMAIQLTGVTALDEATNFVF